MPQRPCLDALPTNICMLLLLLRQVVSGLSSLEELALGSTRISGSLTCDLPRSLKVRCGGD
jgi:hypothetical protein